MDNLQHWLGDFATLLKVQFTITEGMSDDAPIHERATFMPALKVRARSHCDTNSICLSPQLVFHQ